jgi:hypothetical protein
LKLDVLLSKFGRIKIRLLILAFPVDDDIDNKNQVNGRDDNLSDA